MFEISTLTLLTRKTVAETNLEKWLIDVELYQYHRWIVKNAEGCSMRKARLQQPSERTGQSASLDTCMSFEAIFSTEYGVPV